MNSYAKVRTKWVRKSKPSLFQPLEDKAVTFNGVEHKESLRQGSYSFNAEKDKIYLNELNRSGTESKGFGTAVIRELVSMSLKTGKPLVTEAAYSSHLFYLKMGMIPIDCEVSYCPFTYGAGCIRPLEEMHKCTDIEQVKNFDLFTKSKLWHILETEKSWGKKEINDQDLFENRELFSELSNKKVSYLTASFIPMLLDKLQANMKSNSKSDTSGWGSIEMVMSPEGLQRWEEAIKNGVEFRLFRDYSHLRRHMTKEQLEELDQVLPKEKVPSQKSSLSYG